MIRYLHILICFFWVIGCRHSSNGQNNNDSQINIKVLERPANPVMAVNDFANIFSLEEKNRLEKKLRAYYDTTSNEIVLLTLNSIDTFKVEDVSMAYCKKWKFGNKEKNNGILILLSKEPRKVRIEIGKGLEDVLPNSLCDSILKEETIPNLKGNDFFSAFDKTINALTKAVGNKFKNEKN